MVFDLSGVKVVVQDILRAADEYSSHDPELATEMSLRAYEICREFDIDLASFEERKKAGPETRVAEPLLIATPDNLLVRGQADEDQDQLVHILDLQRTLVDEQSVVDGLRQDPKPRSIWSNWRVFNPLIRPQPI